MHDTFPPPPAIAANCVSQSLFRAAPSLGTNLVCVVIVHDDNRWLCGNGTGVELGRGLTCPSAAPGQVKKCRPLQSIQLLADTGFRYRAFSKYYLSVNVTKLLYERTPLTYNIQSELDILLGLASVASQKKFSSVDQSPSAP